MASNQTGTATPGLSSETALLEALIPGYGLVSRFFISYLKIDLNAYLQVLIGFALVAGCIRFIYPRVLDSLSDLFISTAEIRMEDDVFTYMMYWVSRQPHMKKTNRFLASIKYKTDPYWSDSDDSDAEDDDDENGSITQSGGTTVSFDEYWAKLMSRDKYKKIKFTPSKGCHYFWYKGYLMRLQRTQEESRRFALNNERLWLSCFGRNPEILKDLLADGQRAYIERDGNRTVIYRAKRDYDRSFNWVKCMSRSPRPLSTVILDQEQKQGFVDDMREYLHPHTRRWYTDRGIPYRRGYLLHGPPGTGKTSLCFAAAGMLGLKLYLLNLKTNGLDEEGMSSLFAYLPRRCIVLLEDIDTAGVTQTRGKTVVAEDDPPKLDSEKEDAPAVAPGNPGPDGITLSGLLNVIDGVAASEGRILVMTTNHPDQLDPALLRPGRVDMTIGFAYTTEQDVRDLFESIYKYMRRDRSRTQYSTEKGDDLPKRQRQRQLPSTEDENSNKSVQKEERNEGITLRANISDLSAAFVQVVPSGEFTAAEVQGYLLNHKDRPEDAISGASKWVEEIRKKRNS
ncbi:hypothetical protein VI817_003206 [Penicillium citrinum]|nr:hypothetical protein VI817_003206 [Penicillium citrinum]